MTKQQFLSTLWDRLAGMPGEDIGRSMDYYSEIIDDRMEEGLSEEEAVRAVGPMDEVVAQIRMGTPLPKPPKANARRSRSLKVWEIVLLILGSPLWLPLSIVALAILLVVCVIIWLAVLVLYAADLSVASAGIAGLFGAFVQVFSGRLAQGAFLLGSGLACVGLAVLLFFGCNLIARGVLFLNRKMFLGIKSCFVRKGDAL